MTGWQRSHIIKRHRRSCAGPLFAVVLFTHLSFAKPHKALPTVCQLLSHAPSTHRLVAPLWPMTAASSRASSRPAADAEGLSSCSPVCTRLSSLRCGLLCFLSSLLTSSRQQTWYDLGRRQQFGTYKTQSQGTWRMHSLQAMERQHPGGGMLHINHVTVSST